ncbi:MAG: hypothetical protein J0I12_35175, partial [Candidatus Eremiobacteraeota bacterium]|nr:hypothetical protein [Candidatus Eremiobacteraeota bacterium]
SRPKRPNLQVAVDYLHPTVENAHPSRPKRPNLQVAVDYLHPTVENAHRAGPNARIYGTP